MTNEKYLTEISRRLSYALRHAPEKYGLTLSSEGWVNVDLLTAHPDLPNQPVLEEIVRTDSKGRYQFSDDGSQIRATQGHSTAQVDINHSVCTPPVVLYHGSATKNEKSILKRGIVPYKRHHVHLSADYDTALEVGARHGSPIVFIVDTRRMMSAGFKFMQSPNGVWLCDHVPAEYIEVYTRQP